MARQSPVAAGLGAVCNRIRYCLFQLDNSAADNVSRRANHVASSTPRYAKPFAGRSRLCVPGWRYFSYKIICLDSGS